MKAKIEMAALKTDMVQIEKTNKKQLLDRFKVEIKEVCGTPPTKDNLKLLYDAAIEKTNSTEMEELLQEALNSKQLTMENKIELLADYWAGQAAYPGKILVTVIEKFLSIIKTDENLGSFVQDPQLYINTHKNLSAHDLQVLQYVANDPQFKALPSIQAIKFSNPLKAVTASTYIYTSLSQQMSLLYWGNDKETGLKDCASLDAARFVQCINPDPKIKDHVLKAAKKIYHGPQVIGLAGVQKNYGPELMQSTAKMVKQTKTGVCHTFAQLGADHLLKAIASKQLDDMPIKVVSHNAALGSHTFLLVGHKTNDLNDLSNCLIVDPWAVAMGYTNTYGIYTIENYPYPGMTDKLVCFYTNQAHAPSAQEVGPNGGNELKSTGSTLQNSGLFSSLNSKQLITVGFLNQLATLARNTGQGNKLELFEKLKNAVIHKDINPPEQAMKLAVLAFNAKFLENLGTHYSWKPNTALPDSSLLPAFNNPDAIKFWKHYVKTHFNKEVEKIDPPLLKEILEHLNKNDELHTYSPASGTNPTMR